MSATTQELPLLLTALPPSRGQRRLAFAIIVAFAVAFGVALPFANTPLPRLDAWLPMFATALVINDVITAVLFFSQFAITHQRALLVLATGYLFSALTVIPYVLTFPGVFAPTGLLGAGLQSAVSLYLVWHMASPLSVIVYALIKDAKNKTSAAQGTAGFEIGVSIALVIGAVGAVTWFCTAHHDLLPVFYRDSYQLSPLVIVAAGVVFLLCAIALSLLWFRGRSVLDQWLMVTVSAWLFEITLQGLLLTDRFSIAWYMGRSFTLIASCVVLIVLLSEMTILYAHLARTAIRQRMARQSRQVVMDTMAASIAHELSQPIVAIVLNANTAKAFLAKEPPDYDEVRSLVEDIATDGARGSQIIDSLRALFRKSAHRKELLDVNELILEVLAILDINLRSEHVSVSTRLPEDLPQLLADRGQLQQVFLNLIMNAIEAMRSITDRTPRLQITSDVPQGASHVLITIADSGMGIDRRGKDRIFDPFFTTKSTGTGIGLTICQSIIDAHGGSLRASANQPYGTILEVVVPIDTGEVAAESAS